MSKDNDFNDGDFSDWGPDPFEGDMDFDMDFDNPGGKKSFLRSVASGFLDGLSERTIGSTDAKVKTLQRLLPDTWAPTFRNLREFDNRRREIMEELKENGASTVEDLQYLAKRAAGAITGKVPNKISDSLMEFSNRDFSDWAKSDWSNDDTDRIQHPEDGDVKALIDNENANSVLGRETVKAVGKETINMMSEIGGRSIAGMHSIVQATVRTNQLLEHMLDYQRRVQQRNDQLQLNILARHHLTSAAYFKFSEASNHRMITELRAINKYVQMSDYEKTSHSQAMRRSIRESVFNTAKSRFGGFAEFLAERVGKDAREEHMGTIQEISSSLRMVAEMTEGMPINVGSMLGNAAAGVFLNQLPRAINSNKGQELLSRFKKQFPSLSKWAEDAYIRIGDLGNVANYVTSNAEELANTMAKHYNGGTGFEDYETYDDYLSTLAPDVKPMPKAQWWILKKARAAANKTASSVLDDMWASSGSTYQMQQRTLEDGHEQSLWSRRDSRTLTEEIPRWFGLLHQSLERLRTGNDEIKPLVYDYTKARFINSKQAFSKVTNDILNRNQFSTQASMANSLAARMDEGNVLTDAQKQALAFQLIKDSDRKLGFNPYNMLDLDSEGHDKDTAAAIRKMIMQNWDISEEDIDKFLNGDEVTKARMLTYAKGEKNRANLADYAEVVRSLGTFGHDLSDKIDVYKANGFYDAMRQAGIIQKSEYGNQDEINEKLINETIKKFLANPELKSTVPWAEDSPDYATRAMGAAGSTTNLPPKFNPSLVLGSTGSMASPYSEANPLPVKVVGLDEMLKSLDGLKDVSSTLNLASQSLKGLESLNKDSFNLQPVQTSLDKLVSEVGTLVTLADLRNKTLTGIHDRIPMRKKIDKQEQEEVRSGKQRIIDKIKEFSIKDFFNKSVDTVLRNEPLILGGLLGGLAGIALHDHKAAALIAGGAGVAIAYHKFRNFAKSRMAADDEDLYEADSDTPILEVWKRKRGDYYDAVTGKVIEKWGDIKNSVKDVSNNTIIGVKRLAGRLFTSENKEVLLSGLNKAREALGKAWEWLDPLNRLKGMGSKVATRFYQMNVYKEGSSEPTLYGKSFAGGAYWKRGKNGEPTQINGWNEIDGPVYDREGNVLITQEDFDRGLKTSMGVSINKLNNATKKAAGWLWDAAGIVKNKAVEYGEKAYDKSKTAFKADYSPITNSVDRIYHLLLQHWGYQVEIDVPPSIPTGEHGAGEHNKGITPDIPGKASEEVVEARKEQEAKASGKEKHSAIDRFGEKVKEHLAKGDNRLNSLKDQEDKKKKKKGEMVQDAIIGIGKTFGVGKDEDPKPERKGLFGLLTSMVGGAFSTLTGLATFFTKTLWTGIRPMIWFASMGLKVLPAMATGITAIAKGIFTLIKTRSITQAGGSVLDTILDNKDEHPEVRKKRKADRAAHRAKPSTKLKKAGIAAGAAYLAGGALDTMVENGMIEEDGLAANLGNVIETGAQVYAGYQLASGAAALAGVSLPGVAAAAGGALLTGVAWLGAGALAVLSSPFVLGALAVGAVGYGLYKLYKSGSGTQVKLRLTQYGVSDVESNLAEKVLNAEKALTKFVVIGNGRASISKDAPMAEVIKLFVDDPKDKDKLNAVITWFNGRFKPVFLTYMACLDVVKMKSLEEYDQSVSQDVYKVAKQAHSALTGVAPYPYTITAKIDADTPILGEKQTVIRINNYLETLKKYIDRKTPTKDKEAIALPTGIKGLEDRKKQLEGQLKEGSGSVAGPVRSQIKKELTQIDRQLQDLNSNFKVGPQVAGVFIKDLLPDDKPMSLLTAVRIACYGNDEDVHWRVEAVLKLERHCESLFVFDGNQVVFKGQIGELFGLFKDAFRLDSSDGEEWCKWFRDRFAPVMSNYVLLMNGYRKGNPGVVWKSLSATARYEIAKGLVETKAKITSAFIVPIWNVRASPFKGTRSGGKPDKVDRMLKLMSEVSTEAKLRDPEKEAGKTNTQTWANAISPHKTGGGYTEHAANVQRADQYKTRKDMLMGGQFGTNVSRGAGTGNLYSLNGVYGTPANQFGYQALTGDSDTSHLDMSGIQKNEGTDTGIKVPRKLAEQLIIREMLKQGFTDPRAIAEMLALTNYETGGYSKTVENLKYTDPTRLMRLFKEVTSLDQARALIAGGEVAIGNAVYGGAKGRSLGNMEPGDGYKYRGRGMVQLTGKANYAKTGQRLGIDLLNKPELLGSDPNVMAAVAVDFFKNSSQLQSITKDGNFGFAAKGLNGGNELPGMAERHKLYLSYLDQLSKGQLKADEESAKGASAPDTAGSGGAPSPTGAPPGAMPSGGGGAPMPPLSPAPGGGSQYGTPSNAGGGQAAGGWYGSGAVSGGGGGDGTGGGLVLNRTTDNSGLRLKSAETTAGGGHHAGIKRMCELIQTNVKTFKQFTALNDAYHRNKKPNSSHTKGLALDFTLTNGIASSDYAVAVVKGLAQQAGLGANDFLVLNEYKKASAGATGGHIHFNFKSVEAAEKFNKAAGGNVENGQDTTTGGGPVQQQAQPETTPIPPQVPVEAQNPRGTEPETEGNKSYTPVPLPDRKGTKTDTPQVDAAPDTFKRVGQQNPNLAPQPQPEVTKPRENASPPPGPDLDALVGKLSEAMQGTGDKSALLLAEVVKQLQELNKNSKQASKAVPVR